MRTTATALLALVASFATLGSVSAAPVTTGTGGVPTYTQCNRPGVFALTFDDGPFQYSWDLAKYLGSRGIKATFFTNGHNWVTTSYNTTTTTTKADGPKTYIEVLQLYNQLGHEIASHTYNHINLAGLTTAQVEHQMNAQSDLIFQAIGKRPTLMRPPEGVTDSTSTSVLNRLGYSNIMWDVDTKDYEGRGFAYEQSLVRAVVDKDVPGQTPGHIALQHDVHSESAVELTPWLVDYIISKNYTFVTVSECLGIPAYH